MNKHGVYRSGFTETNVKHRALRIITNITMEYGKLKKKRISSQVYFKYFDTEKLSKMQIYLQVFFKGFTERFGTTCIYLDFLEVVFRIFCR